MDKDQSFAALLASSIVAIIQPIQGGIFAFLMVAVLNVIVGCLTAINCKGEEFQIRKFVDALFQVLAVLLSITCIYTVSHLQGDASQGQTATSFLVYVAVYMYGSNIAKNLCIAWPHNQFFQILHYLLSAKWMGILDKVKTMKHEATKQTENSKNTTL